VRGGVQIFVPEVADGVEVQPVVPDVKDVVDVGPVVLVTTYNKFRHC